MRRTARFLCSAAAVLGLTACGSQAAPTTATPPSVFPLTITRTGGIAGFQDAAKRLTTGAAKVPWTRLTPGSTTASFPDDLITMVLSPVGGPVRVEDPQVGAAGAVFNELVNDLNGGRSASGMCTPV